MAKKVNSYTIILKAITSFLIALAIGTSIFWLLAIDQILPSSLPALLIIPAISFGHGIRSLREQRRERISSREVLILSAPIAIFVSVVGSLAFDLSALQSLVLLITLIIGYFASGCVHRLIPITWEEAANKRQLASELNDKQNSH
jgi:hypothetical protein